VRVAPHAFHSQNQTLDYNFKCRNARVDPREMKTPEVARGRNNGEPGKTQAGSFPAKKEDSIE
jgi:hypothetical protein